MTFEVCTENPLLRHQEMPAILPVILFQFVGRFIEHSQLAVSVGAIDLVA